MISWFRHTQITADFSRKEIVDFAMPGNAGSLVIGGVDILDGVFRAFPQELAAVRFEMTDQIGAFHGS
jgi:hypothetical protein